ncbi:carboxypeptidase regulatory-like domain-containing protein [Brevundimonas denitrificans]|uniref:carboxypeptidase regulatory-like domain-containing protein n=1 Tax=Brevundimonas denitrificans TaxID=1443434 RepID=UPI00223B4B51|nr:carboxypeptidase regulatory-like domain-containing protein [Brevundimonas denitrificans]
MAAQTNTNVVFSGDQVSGKTAPALRGSYSAEGAYRAMLRGSGLRLGVTDGGSFVVSAPVAGQAARQGQGALVGQVSIAEGARSPDGALVRIAETGQTTSVDQYGSFRFPSLPAGDYTVEISFLGYEPLVETVTVPAEGRTSRPSPWARPTPPRSRTWSFSARAAPAPTLSIFSARPRTAPM